LGGDNFPVASFNTNHLSLWDAIALIQSALSRLKQAKI